MLGGLDQTLLDRIPGDGNNVNNVNVIREGDSISLVSSAETRGCTRVLRCWPPELIEAAADTRLRWAGGEGGRCQFDSDNLGKVVDRNQPTSSWTRTSVTMTFEQHGQEPPREGMRVVG